MSDPSEMPWSNDLDAPQIPSWMYLEEKEYFAGFLVGATFYGVVVALFFQCIGALLSSTNPIRRGIKWALVVHTVAMFSFFTIPVGINLSALSLEYINNREFPGNDEYPPGPLGYDDGLSSKVTSIVFIVMFPLNQWLADGLLLHRCYIVYSMNYWVMSLPCLIYLASVAMGIANVYQLSGPLFGTITGTNIATSYYSICLSLNVLLTLMIVVRLAVHIRNVRKATGSSGGLHTTTAAVVAMLIESYALYAITLITYIVPLAIQSPVVSIFNGVLGAVQVIAPYLIILRVAKRRALTSESISGVAESMRFKSQGSTVCDGSLPDGESTTSMEVDSGGTGELAAGDENAIREVPL